MRTKVFYLLLFVMFNSINTFAQISIPPDSINLVLCKKWNYKGLLMGGQRLTNMSESVSYEFLANGNVNRTTSKGKKETGKWQFNSSEKTITIKFKKARLKIVELTTTELIVLVDKESSENALGVGTILKPAELK